VEAASVRPATTATEAPISDGNGPDPVEEVVIAELDGFVAGACVDGDGPDPIEEAVVVELGGFAAGVKPLARMSAASDVNIKRARIVTLAVRKAK
jgi:hypothetical protein